MDARRNWTREETMLAFELYCTIPSGQDRANNPLIISLANAINRTPNSVKLKLQNFKSYDPSYTGDGRIGLSHGSRLDKEVCEEFLGNWDDLVVKTFEIRKRLGLSINVETDEIPDEIFVGGEVAITTKRRIGQSFFRRTLLASYSSTCCITGLKIAVLLRASHIKPWAVSNDINEKSNPQNGVLLNALHDAAFDKGLITITPNYKVAVSKLLLDESRGVDFFARYDGLEIRLPSKFLPAREFLEYHNDVVFVA